VKIERKPLKIPPFSFVDPLKAFNSSHDNIKMLFPGFSSPNPKRENKLKQRLYREKTLADFNSKHFFLFTLKLLSSAEILCFSAKQESYTEKGKNLI
jgi:thioredoxin-related protein